MAPGFVNEQVAALGEGCVGRDAYRDRLPAFLALLPGLRYEIEDVVAEGERLAVAYRMRAEPDGRPVDLRGVMLLEVRDGSIARRTDYWDALTFLRQTGAAE